MPPPAWDQMKTELANTNRKVNPSDRWRTTSWFHQPLSVVFPPQIQHSSVLFKLGETRSAFLLYFSSYVLRPSYFLCWVASHQKTCEPVVLGTTKLEIQDALICIHICVMKTQHPVGLMLPCIILSALIVCVWIPATVGVGMHMCVSSCAKPKWHSVSCIGDDVTLLQSRRLRRSECWWCTDTSAWCLFLTDGLTCRRLYHHFCC